MERTSTPQPRPSIPLLLLLAAMLLGCAQPTVQSYYLESRGGAGAYARVDCAHESNPHGFSVEFPRCFCNGGVRLDYVVERSAGRAASSYFILRRGYLSAATPEITIFTRDGYKIDRLRVDGGDGRPVEIRRTASTRGEWRRNEQLLGAIMAEYAPRLYEIEMLCRAEALSAG